MRASIVLFAFVALFAASVFARPEGRKSLFDCEPVPGDKRLYARHVQDGGIPLTKRHRTVYYPEKGEGGPVINCIKVIDNIAETSPHGGSVKIESGGVGQTYVIITITSERGEGYNFDIEIYGQKKSNTTGTV